MSILYLLLIIIGLIILILIVKYVKGELITNINILEFFRENKYWIRNKCKYEMSETIKNVLNDNNIIEMNNNDKESIDYDLYLPCGYNDINEEIKNLEVKSPKGRIFIIKNADELIAKERLWKYVKNTYGINKAKELMPNSYILDDKDDMERLKRDFKGIYIMKKNIQRQEGLKITDSLEDILKGKERNYVVVQELLQDPYLINGRKINIRFYCLVICKENNYNVYCFDDGFMYYTKELFKMNSLLDEHNITTGYIDRKVYEENPLTQKDFREYLDSERLLTKNEELIKKKNKKLSEYGFNNIYKLLQEIFICYKGILCNKEKKYNNLSFQLFGVDIAVDNKLKSKIMEINKGPDLGAKDKRDSELKHKCVKDMFKLIGLIENDEENNGFIKLI